MEEEASAWWVCRDGRKIKLKKRNTTNEVHVSNAAVARKVAQRGCVVRCRGGRFFVFLFFKNFENLMWWCRLLCAKVSSILRYTWRIITHTCGVPQKGGIRPAAASKN